MYSLTHLNIICYNFNIFYSMIPKTTKNVSSVFVYTKQASWWYRGVALFPAVNGADQYKSSKNIHLLINKLNGIK